jgi:hypothetical protein
MTANELRIGNYFKTTISKDRGMPIKALAIKGDGIGYTEFGSDYIYVRIEDIKPIPLTPEILEKAGFEKSIEVIGGWLYYKDDFNICYLDSGIVKLQVDDCNYGQPFKYVHQLQNLYFALTGNELEILLG